MCTMSWRDSKLWKLLEWRAKLPRLLKVRFGSSSVTCTVATQRQIPMTILISIINIFLSYSHDLSVSNHNSQACRMRNCQRATRLRSIHSKEPFGVGPARTYAYCSMGYGHPMMDLADCKYRPEYVNAVLLGAAPLVFLDLRKVY